MKHPLKLLAFLTVILAVSSCSEKVPVVNTQKENYACNSTDKFCDQGLVCVDNVCRRVCVTDAQCDSSQQCIEQTCLPATNKGCASAANCITPGICELAVDAECVAGKCVYKKADSGTACDDDNICTTNDKCDDDGLCVGLELDCTTDEKRICVENDTIFRTYNTKGKCDKDAGGCVYDYTDLSCDSCTINCLSFCENVTCKDTTGQCVNYICDPKSTDDPPCSPTNKAVGTTCQLSDNSLGYCDNGVCYECVADKDCQNYPTWHECFEAICQNHKCVYNPAVNPEACGNRCVDGKIYNYGNCINDGKACDADITKDCHGLACNAAGNDCLESCQTNDDCLTDFICGNGACYPEVAIGEACNPAANGHDCIQGTCKDGICCSSECTGTCQACNLPGSLGTCTNVPENQQDNDTCSGKKACDGNGNCVKSLGENCGSHSECASGACVDGVCCGSSECGRCQSCAVAGHEGSCYAVAAGAVDDSCGFGQVCSATRRCVYPNGAIGSKCQNDTDCLSNHCDKRTGICCASGDCCISDNTQCPAHMSCNATTHTCRTSTTGDICENNDRCNTSSYPGDHCVITSGHRGICSNGNTGDPCVTDKDCDSGYHCSTLTNTCFKGNIGSVGCLLDSDCDKGHHCRASTQTCVHGQTYKDDDGPRVPDYSYCDDHDDCDSRSCINSICTKTKVGSHCTFDSDCGSGRYCRFSTRTCVSGEASDSCDDDGDCSPSSYKNNAVHSGIHCRQSTNKCVSGSPGDSSYNLGDSCDDDCDCDDYHRCINGHCREDEQDFTKDCSTITPKLKNGYAGCNKNADCESNHCDTSNGVCCASGNCCVDDSNQCPDHMACDTAKHMCREAVTGDRCRTNADCLSGDHCYMVEGQIGKCVSGNNGSECHTAADCDSGYQCNSVTKKCFAGNNGSVGCYQNADCDGGLHCRISTHTCYSGDDTPCDSNDECDDGYYCKDHICDSSPLGIPCQYDRDCSGDYCQASTGICVEGYIGYPCDDDGDCGLGMHCRQSTNTCESGGIGDPCDNDEDCDDGTSAWGHHCRVDTNTCVSGNPGSTDGCFDNCDCDDLHICVNRICSEDEDPNKVCPR